MGANQTASIDGPIANDTITFTFDELGRVNNRKINGNANSETWSYDSLGRMSSDANKLGTFTYSYIGREERGQLQNFALALEKRLPVKVARGPESACRI